TPVGLRNTASVLGPAGNCHVRNSISTPSYVARPVIVTTGGPPSSTGAMHSSARFRAARRHCATSFHLPVRNDRRAGASPSTWSASHGPYVPVWFSLGVVCPNATGHNARTGTRTAARFTLMISYCCAQSRRLERQQF